MIRALVDYARLKWHVRHWSAKRIKRYHTRRLRLLVRYVKKHSPFYHDIYGTKMGETLTDFRALPTINKQVMMHHFDTLNTKGLKREEVELHALQAEQTQSYLGYYKKRYVVGLSSGTSGHRGLYITPRSLTKRLPGVFLARGGVGVADLPLRIIFMLRVYSQGFDDINAPFIKLQYLPTTAEAETVVLRLETMDANVLMAPPSMIRFLLPYADRIAGRLKRMITYAEVLTQEDKERYATAFKTQVVEIYQASEGQIASPCKHGYLHINEDLVHVDIYDANHQRVHAPGVVGQKMIISNLVNTVQPLLRYEMNDMIVLDTPCPCGSHFRRIKHVLGRHDDVFYFLDAAGQAQPVFPDLIARWLLTGDNRIAQFQATQSEYGQMRIVVEPLGEAFATKALQAHISEALKALNLQGTIDVEMGTLAVPKEAHKFKRFIQHDARTLTK